MNECGDGYHLAGCVRKMEEADKKPWKAAAGVKAGNAAAGMKPGGERNIGKAGTGAAAGMAGTAGTAGAANAAYKKCKRVASYGNVVKCGDQCWPNDWQTAGRNCRRWSSHEWRRRQRCSSDWTSWSAGKIATRRQTSQLDNNNK